MLSKYEMPPQCACDTCKSMCDVPGLLTPMEALELISQDKGSYLMARECGMWWCLSPAVQEHHARRGPYFIGHGRGYQCVFFKDGLCSLYKNPGRPSECRLAHCSHTNGSMDINQDIRNMWNSPEGEYVMQVWEEHVGDWFRR